VDFRQSIFEQVDQAVEIRVDRIAGARRIIRLGAELLESPRIHWPIGDGDVGTEAEPSV
jgi:hypothetical protein